MPKWFKRWPWYRKTGWVLWVLWMLLAAAMIAFPSPNTRTAMVIDVVIISVVAVAVIRTPIWLWHKIRRRTGWKPRTSAAVGVVAYPPVPVVDTFTAYPTEPAVTTPPRRNILGEKGRPLYSIAQVYGLSPAEFEQLCVRLLARMGYKNLERTGGAGDLMADIKGTDPDGRSFVCQCKRYQLGQQLGSPLIQTFIGMQSVHHKAQSGMIITTATFTDPAVTLAFRHNITLINGARLMDLLDRNDLRRF